MEASGAATPLPTKEAEPQHQTVESVKRPQVAVGPIAIAVKSLMKPGT